VLISAISPGSEFLADISGNAVSGGDALRHWYKSSLMVGQNWQIKWIENDLVMEAGSKPNYR
jgi:hypothetical protein